MFALFREGLESAFFPCTLVVLLPGVAVTLAARYYSTLAVVGFTTGLIVAAWFRLSGRGGDWPNYIIAVLFLAGGLFFLRPITQRLDLTSMVAGLTVGAGSAALWQPCTGQAFGTLSNELPEIGGTGALKLGIYLVGLLAPLFILGALFYFIPDRFQERVEEKLAYVGATCLIVISFSVLIGVDDEIISKLFEWSDTTSI